MAVNGAGGQKPYSSVLFCTWFSSQSQCMCQKPVVLFAFSSPLSAQLLVLFYPARKVEKGNAVLPLAIIHIMKVD